MLKNVGNLTSNHRQEALLILCHELTTREA